MGRIFPAPLFTPGFLDTTGGTLQQPQTAFDRANEDLYAILYLTTDKAAALLVAMRAYDERGARGDGQNATKELEDKHLRITDKTIRALARCFLLQPSALSLFLPRTTRSRPSTLTTTSTAASSSKKRSNRHSKGRY